MTDNNDSASEKEKPVKLKPEKPRLIGTTMVQEAKRREKERDE